uniref:Uncharacterized protein n=1 Tax=Colletotrichum fructicola (strain Nara gc5) TaxID=1213859 RepID=L2GBG6_COLFN
MGPEAFEHVLANSTAPQVFGLIRLVAIVRTATADDPPATSLDAFVKRANHHMQHSGRGQFYSSIPPLTRTYQRQKTGAVRSLLQIARRIAYLTPACLSYYREQWLSATPSHAEGDMRGWVYKTWKNRYAGRPYSPDDIGPPVWIEEHRVTRGFWRLQLLYELQRATSENRLGWKMDETRGPVSAEGLYGALRYEKEEFFTVSDFVNRIQGESSSWSHTRGYLMSQNPVGWVYANIRLRHFPPSPIRGVPLQPFRRLGLFIWEYDKLVKMELMSPTGYPFSAKGEPSKMYTWRSLLSQEILAEVEENLDLGSNRRQTTHTDAAFGLPPL